VTQAEFIRMAREPGRVLLTLAKAIPTRDTRILIYCNNNFGGAPDSFPVKAVISALNLSTFVSLHAYGYRNVYELGPVIDVSRTKLTFAGEEVRYPALR
jgi:hypothetical protein